MSINTKYYSTIFFTVVRVKLIKNAVMPYISRPYGTLPKGVTF